MATITKTCQYNFDPLKSHFYIVKLGFIVVYIIFLFPQYIIFLIFLGNRLWVLVRTTSPHRDEYLQSMFWAEIWKISGGGGGGFIWKISHFALRKHAYSNTLKFLPSQNDEFQIKNSDIFHISAQNIDYGDSLEPPRRGDSNEYPQSIFLSRIKKN